MISLDASVLVKWFKKGEENEEWAMKLKDKVLSREIVPIVNEYVFLEIVRAMKKAGFPKTKIVETARFLEDLEILNYVNVVTVKEVRNLAIELIHELNLYASDALVLATSLSKHATLVTEDKHLLRRNIKKYAENKNINIFRLNQLKII